MINLYKFFRRNTHGVSSRALEAMLERYNKNVTIDEIVKSATTKGIENAVANKTDTAIHENKPINEREISPQAYRKCHENVQRKPSHTITRRPSTAKQTIPNSSASSGRLLRSSGGNAGTKQEGKQDKNVIENGLHATRNAVVARENVGLNLVDVVTSKDGKSLPFSLAHSVHSCIGLGAEITPNMNETECANEALSSESKLKLSELTSTPPLEVSLNDETRLHVIEDGFVTVDSLLSYERSGQNRFLCNETSDSLSTNLNEVHKEEQRRSAEWESLTHYSNSDSKKLASEQISPLQPDLVSSKDMDEVHSEQKSTQSDISVKQVSECSDISPKDSDLVHHSDSNPQCSSTDENSLSLLMEIPMPDKPVEKLFPINDKPCQNKAHSAKLKNPIHVEDCDKTAVSDANNGGNNISFVKDHLSSVFAQTVEHEILTDASTKSAQRQRMPDLVVKPNPVVKPDAQIDAENVVLSSNIKQDVIADTQSVHTANNNLDNALHDHRVETTSCKDNVNGSVDLAVIVKPSNNDSVWTEDKNTTWVDVNDRLRDDEINNVLTVGAKMVGKDSASDCKSVNSDEQSSELGSPDSLQFLKDCFPNTEIDMLKSFLNSCNGDLLKTVDSLLEYKESDYQSVTSFDHDLTEEGATRQTFDVNLQRSVSAPLEEPTKSRDVNVSPSTDIALPDSKTLEENRNQTVDSSDFLLLTSNNDNKAHDVLDDPLQLTLHPALALQLLEMFGAFSGVSGKGKVKKWLLVLLLLCYYLKIFLNFVSLPWICFSKCHFTISTIIN